MSEKVLIERLRALRGPWLGDGIAPAINRDEIIDTIARLTAERDAARREALEEAARLCERAQPAGGRAWSTEQAACFDALAHVAAAIRAAKGEP